MNSLVGITILGIRVLIEISGEPRFYPYRISQWTVAVVSSFPGEYNPPN
jgi:hypothetical protein